MKKMNLMLLCFCMVFTASLAFAGNPGLGYRADLFKPVKIQLQSHTTSIVFNKNYRTVPLRYDASCGKYKRLQVAGFVLVGCGAGMLTTGVILIGVGSANAYNGGSDFATAGMVAGGAVCTVFGVGMLGAGIPLSIIGSVKLRKYCRGSSFNYSITPTGTGINLACRF